MKLDHIKLACQQTGTVRGFPFWRCLPWAAILFLGSLQAGELDQTQMQWFKHYQRQENLPKPSEMLLNTEPEPMLGEDFVELFNGKDLNGWKTRDGDSPFEVQDGCIVATCKLNSPST